MILYKMSMRGLDKNIKKVKCVILNVGHPKE